MSEVMDNEEIQQSGLVNRLSNYTLVNTLYNGYSTIKEKNSYIKVGFETAESLTQPVLKKLDDTLHLDERGTAILDKIETTASGISNKVSGYYNQGVDFYTVHKENAVETGKVLVATANRPVNQLLDVTEALVNKILPPELPIPPLDSDEDDKESSERENAENISDHTQSETEDDHLSSNPIPRIKQMGTGVSKRLQNAALLRLQNLRSKQQLESLAYVVDLVQYAAEYIDLDGKTKVLKENATLLHNLIEEKKEFATNKFVIPAKEIIEQQTSDIKDLSTKAIVAVVASIAHVTEVVRRQVTNKVPSVSKLQSHLTDITRRTKEAVLKMKGKDLENYINMVRETYKTALHSIIELTSAYTPSKLLESMPILLQLSTLLSNWRLSLTTRLEQEKLNKDDEQTTNEPTNVTD